jgi:hypothetical protein
MATCWNEFVGSKKKEDDSSEDEPPLSLEGKCLLLKKFHSNKNV